jgi:membrane protein YdbS with pleckstrin-like domain
MKPFRINRNSWHYKMNRRFSPYYDNPNYMEYNWEPRHSNFCAYWRITAFKLIWLGFMTFGIVGLFYGLATAIYAHPIVALKVTGAIISVIIGFIVLVFLFAGISKTNEKVAKSNSLFVQKYRAQKSKICPTVEFE